MITKRSLVQIINDSIGRFYKNKKIHPATKIFQALRIATNSELTNLEKVIEKGFDRLSVTGRIAVISFHKTHSYKKLSSHERNRRITLLKRS